MWISFNVILRTLLASKGAIATKANKGIVRVGKGNRAGQDF